MFRRLYDGVYITSKCSKFMYVRLLSYHSKWGESFSNPLCILHLWNSADVSNSQNHFFACLLLSRIPDLTILCMILLCLLFFTLSHDASPPVVSMDIWIIQQVSWWHLLGFTKHRLNQLLYVCMDVVHSSVFLGWSGWCGQGLVWMH